MWTVQYFYCLLWSFITIVNIVFTHYITGLFNDQIYEIIYFWHKVHGTFYEIWICLAAHQAFGFRKKKKSVRKSVRKKRKFVRAQINFCAKNWKRLHIFYRYFSNQTPDQRILPIKPNRVFQLANVSTLLARCLAAHGQRALAFWNKLLKKGKKW
jgi:hypothetical protein